MRTGALKISALVFYAVCFGIVLTFSLVSHAKISADCVKIWENQFLAGGPDPDFVAKKKNSDQAPTIHKLYIKDEISPDYGNILLNLKIGDILDFGEKEKFTFNGFIG